MAILKSFAGENKALALTTSEVSEPDLRGLDENLHAAMTAENKMESRLLLDVVIRKSVAIFELFAGEHKALTLTMSIVSEDPISEVMVLDVRVFLHTAMKAENEMKS